MLKRLTGEFIGSLWLVLGGCGSIIFASSYLRGGIGLIGISLAFGLAATTATYALGHISGAHLNPAVTIGLFSAGRFRIGNIIPYILAQVAGAVVAAAIIYFIVRERPGFSLRSGFAANGFERHSPGSYKMMSVLIAEAIVTFFLVLIVLGVTDEKAPRVFSGLTIGCAVTIAYILLIPISNGSANPARSTGQALFVGGWAISQLWVFWVAPTGGGFFAGLVYKTINAMR